MSSISGDSHPPPQSQPQPQPPSGSNFLRKASTQLKLPVSISRTMTSTRPRAESKVQDQQPDGSKSQRENSPEIREIRRSMSKKRSSEIKLPLELGSSEAPLVPPLHLPAPSPLPPSSSTPLTKEIQEDPCPPPQGITKNEKIKKLKERKMKKFEEEEEQRRLQEEEKAREEQLRQHLEKEHQRWKIKDKKYEIYENNQKKILTRSLSERLFLRVGEKNEFLDEQDREQEQEEGMDHEKQEIKIIQGTLAAELIELIEKSRFSRPTEIKGQQGRTSSPPPSSTPAPPGAGTSMDEEKDSTFDEDEYFREIAALSLESEEYLDIPYHPHTKSGKVQCLVCVSSHLSFPLSLRFYPSLPASLLPSL